MASPSPLEPLLIAADRALRAVFAPPTAARPSPNSVADVAEGSCDSELSDADRAKSAALMRVNHSGEVAAQALYHGQAFFARDPDTRSLLLRAAREEADHLAWCEGRIAELGGRTSLLNPLFYAGSFAIGAAAAVLGDQASLGFLSETERQVEQHLQDHLTKLPDGDSRSRAVLAAMKHDEAEHGANARAAGAEELPESVKLAMQATSRVMTVTSYWV
jgi:ubiquinone biosynthesis monooxygenase Coq7